MGLEPSLYECLASTFRQVYPPGKLSVHLCVPSRDDAAYPVLRRVLADFPDIDARIYVEEDDPLLHGAAGHVHNLGPNPKIRNLSRGYREARGDLVWIIDCNVWVSRGAAARMADKLCGRGPGGRRVAPYKFVHHLPLVVDVSPGAAAGAGARLDEMFMATTHAKFYSAINTVGVAPCIVGKSNMFRRSHLDQLTDPARNPVLRPADAVRGRGLDFFSSYICEDHLVGDLLWRSRLPGYRNHGLVPGDLAVQPMAGTSAAAYVARRVRWLRVRKWTVLLATLVEPGVESLLCCFYFAFAATTAPAISAFLGTPQTWRAFAALWLGAVLVWLTADWYTCRKLHAFQSVEVDEHTPDFARGARRRGGTARRPFGEWLLAWVGREVLALPIWIWAVLLGTTVTWRGKGFRVRMDMSVVEIDDKGRAKQRLANGAPAKPPPLDGKRRLD